ncbi:unnamed protein product [Amoebophrya sp. A120]|nr:unnamed protein product [Amoebophrya sp. A120]|eukprot:GSA120T00022171001.1
MAIFGKCLKLLHGACTAGYRGGSQAVVVDPAAMTGKISATSEPVLVEPNANDKNDARDDDRISICSTHCGSDDDRSSVAGSWSPTSLSEDLQEGPQELRELHDVEFISHGFSELGDEKVGCCAAAPRHKVDDVVLREHEHEDATEQDSVHHEGVARPAFFANQDPLEEVGQGNIKSPVKTVDFVEEAIHASNSTSASPCSSHEDQEKTSLCCQDEGGLARVGIDNNNPDEETASTLQRNINNEWHVTLSAPIVNPADKIEGRRTTPRPGTAVDKEEKDQKSSVAGNLLSLGTTAAPCCGPLLWYFDLATQIEKARDKLSVDYKELTPKLRKSCCSRKSIEELILEAQREQEEEMESLLDHDSTGLLSFEKKSPCCRARTTRSPVGKMKKKTAAKKKIEVVVEEFDTSVLRALEEASASHQEPVLVALTKQETKVDESSFEKEPTAEQRDHDIPVNPLEEIWKKITSKMRMTILPDMLQTNQAYCSRITLGGNNSEDLPPAPSTTSTDPLTTPSTTSLTSDNFTELLKATRGSFQGSLASPRRTAVQKDMRRGSVRRAGSCSSILNKGSKCKNATTAQRPLRSALKKANSLDSFFLDIKESDEDGRSPAENRSLENKSCRFGSPDEQFFGGWEEKSPLHTSSSESCSTPGPRTPKVARFASEIQHVHDELAPFASGELEFSVKLPWKKFGESLFAELVEYKVYRIPVFMQSGLENEKDDERGREGNSDVDPLEEEENKTEFLVSLHVPELDEVEGEGRQHDLALGAATDKRTTRHDGNKIPSVKRTRKHWIRVTREVGQEDITDIKSDMMKRRPNGRRIVKMTPYFTSLKTETPIVQ